MQELFDIRGRDATSAGLAQERGDRRALAGKQTHIAFGLGQGQRAPQAVQRRRAIALGVEDQLQQDQRPDRETAVAGRLGVGEQLLYGAPSGFQLPLCH